LGEGGDGREGGERANEDLGDGRHYY
jgi:hypothetical protein